MVNHIWGKVKELSIPENIQTGRLGTFLFEPRFPYPPGNFRFFTLSLSLSLSLGILDKTKLLEALLETAEKFVTPLGTFKD